MKIKTSWMVVSAVALLPASGFAAGESQAALMREAKVDRTHAEKIAIAAAHGGKIKSSELEREHGKLIWSCDITKSNVSGITEVAVDAKLGKVVAVTKESAADEAREEKAEKKDKR
jgi:uncharacterized membrane protein YkoI